MMTEEQLCLKVQKNWIRIKHETHSIRDRLMDKLLAEGAISVDQIKDIKCRPREEQFDFCLYNVIESRECKTLLRVFEMYGRRPLCIAIRKTELGDEDYNTSTRSKLLEMTQNYHGSGQHHIPQVNHVQTEPERIDKQMTEHVDDFKELAENISAKTSTLVVKKKVTKKKVKSVVHREEVKKVKDENDRLKAITKVKSDEVSKLRAQLDAKTEEVKWLKSQVEDKDSKQRNQANLLRKSQDEKLNLKKRLRDSKIEQLELTTQLMDKESKINDLKTKSSEGKIHGQVLEEKAVRQFQISNSKKDKSCDEFPPGNQKHVRFENEEDSLENKRCDQTIHDVQNALKNAIEEKECVNRLLKLENAEVLKLTIAIRTKSEENENLQRQIQDIGSPLTKINNKIRINDFEIQDAKDNLERHMKEIEELTERLKPITVKIKEIKESLKILEEK